MINETTDAAVRASLALGRQLEAAMHDLAEAMRLTARQTDELAQALRRFGRRHRSGHRHYGTASWALRRQPGRPDLPLGTRTRAKLMRAP